MSLDLPAFRYHPDPLATGMIEQNDAQCICCGMQRGFIYVGPVYALDELHESLCPWCISDGSAAKKLGASFADDHPLRNAKLSEPIVNEVHLRTPAYSSWQQEQWLVHCEDACAYLGDASIEDVTTASQETKLAWQAEYGLDEDAWAQITGNYQPRGHQAFYKFKCLHCNAILLGWDCS